VTPRQLHRHGAAGSVSDLDHRGSKTLTAAYAGTRTSARAARRDAPAGRRRVRRRRSPGTRPAVGGGSGDRRDLYRDLDGRHAQRRRHGERRTASCTASVAAGTCNLTPRAPARRPSRLRTPGTRTSAGAARRTPHTVTAASTTTALTGHTPVRRRWPGDRRDLHGDLNRRDADGERDRERWPRHVHGDGRRRDVQPDADDRRVETLTRRMRAMPTRRSASAGTAHTVNAAATTTTITAVANPSAVGQAASFTSR